MLKDNAIVLEKVIEEHDFHAQRCGDSYLFPFALGGLISEIEVVGSLSDSWMVFHAQLPFRVADKARPMALRYLNEANSHMLGARFTMNFKNGEMTCCADLSTINHIPSEHEVFVALMAVPSSVERFANGIVRYLNGGDHPEEDAERDADDDDE